MKTIISGSRALSGYDARMALYAHMATLPWKVTEVVSGTARGVDKLGEAWARHHDIPIKRFRPNWYPEGVYDPGAGFKRNRLMALYADALVVLWDGQSRGTENMVLEADKRGLPTKVFVLAVEEL